MVCPEGSVTVTVVGGSFGAAAPADRRDELALLTGENHLVTNQVRSRLSAPAVRAVAEAAIDLEELLAARDLFGRSRRTLRIVRSTLRRSLRSSHCCGTCDDHTAEEPKASR